MRIVKCIRAVSSASKTVVEGLTASRDRHCPRTLCSVAVPRASRAGLRSWLGAAAAGHQPLPTASGPGAGGRECRTPNSSLHSCRARVMNAGLHQRGLSDRASDPGAAPSALTAAQEREIRRVFDQWDTDGDGSISAAELGAAMRSIGLEPTAEEVRERIASVDRSGTGCVEFPEFREMMSGRLAAPAAAPASREVEWTRGHAVAPRERAGAVKGEWALCVVTPADPHSNWGLSLFKDARRGAGLCALVCVPRAPAPGQTRARAREVQARGGALNEMLVAGVLDVEHSADEGRLNARKMVAGAPVAVRLDFKSSAAYRHIVVERVLNVVVPVVVNTLGNALMAYLKSSYRFNVRPLRPVMALAVVSGNMYR